MGKPRREIQLEIPKALRDEGDAEALRVWSLLNLQPCLDTCKHIPETAHPCPFLAYKGNESTGCRCCSDCTMRCANDALLLKDRRRALGI